MIAWQILTALYSTNAVFLIFNIIFMKKLKKLREGVFFSKKIKKDV